MSKLEELYSKASIAAQQQINQILQSGPIEVRPAEPAHQTYGKFKSKITDLNAINFENYQTAKDLEDHLRFSDFPPHHPGVGDALRRFFDSDHGKSTIKQTRLEDLC